MGAEQATLGSAIDAVRARVAEAAARAGRAAEEITIVAVAKTFPPEAVAGALAHGLSDIGENRVQELLAKQAALAGSPARWHFVGPLQSNKARRVAGAVVLIHSIDSEPLARAVGRHAAAAGVVQEVLLQINVSGEATKHGVALAEAPRAAEAVAAIEGIRLRGLMAIPAPGAGARVAFAAMRGLRDSVAAGVPSAIELSMGMSADMEAAIEEGATIVRVGSAIFGPRTER